MFITICLLIACSIQVFTSVPPLAIGLFDRTVTSESMLKYPKLYKESQNAEIYNTKVTDCSACVPLGSIVFSQRFLLKVLLSSNRKCVSTLSARVDAHKVIAWEKSKSLWVLCRREVFFFEEVTAKESEFKSAFAWNWAKVLAVKNCGFCSWFFFLAAKRSNCCVFVGILDVDRCVCVPFLAAVLSSLFHAKTRWVLTDATSLPRSKKKRKPICFHRKWFLSATFKTISCCIVGLSEAPFSDGVIVGEWFLGNVVYTVSLIWFVTRLMSKESFVVRHRSDSILKPDINCG